MKIKIEKIRENAVIPARASLQAAGADLYACLDSPETIMPGEKCDVPLGFRTEFDPGYAAFIYARSGLACKNGLAPANKVGIVDSDYRGEWFVSLYNHSGTPKVIEANERIAQVVFSKIEKPEFEEVDSLQSTERGEGGFGSTGKL